MFKRGISLNLALCVLITLLPFALQAQKASEGSRNIRNFDSDWRFVKADANGVEAPAFDDSKWRKLDVPHDWSIEGEYDETNPTGRGGGYLPAGIGWYRKTFTVDAGDANKKVFIEFDGVMANSDVWINGFHLGKRPSGYVSFSYELTGHLKFGKGEKNVLAVRADNSLQPASRYYTGAGIYRHVRLVTTNPIHISPWGVYIRSLQVSDKKAILDLQIQVTNETSTICTVSVLTTITDPSGKIVKTVESKIGTIPVTTTISDPSGKIVKTIESNQSIQAGRTGTVNLSLEVLSPQLWDTNNPNMYRATTQIKSGKVIIDEQTNTFGIRESKFEAATGYWLNGKNIKIKGVCLHHDAGALGAAVPESVWERRLSLLKEAGVNAIRTAHDPVAPEFLDVCDPIVRYSFK
jgi:beta-galactosidase